MTLSLSAPSVNGDITTYTATSTHNPNGTVFRIAVPSTPAAVPQRCLLVLPVKPGTSTEFGDGLDEIVNAGLHNTYNCVCLAPTFPTEPWIGDHPTNAAHKYESFLITEVVPYYFATLADTQADAVWVLSFSKGAYSALTLFGRYPAVFTACAAWDAPAQVAWTIGGGWEMDEAYGSEAAWEADYRLETHATTWFAPLATQPARLFLSGDTSIYTADTLWLRDLLLATNLRLWFEGSIVRAHRWDSGWVPVALAALHAMAVARAAQFPGQPTQATTLFLPEPLTQGLQLALVFHPQNGTTLWNAGLGSGVTPGTLLTFQSTIERTAVPTELVQTAGPGVLLGSGFTALDQQDKTLIVWCRPTALTADQGLISKDFDLGNNDDGGWGMILAADSRLTFYVDAGHRQSDSGSVPLVAGADVMCAVTYQASTGTARFYLDGVFTSEHVDATAVESPSGSAQLNLGAIRNNTGMFFVGHFRQIRGYNRRLTDQEIATLAANPYLGYSGFSGEPAETTGLLLSSTRSCVFVGEGITLQYLTLAV